MISRYVATSDLKATLMLDGTTYADADLDKAILAASKAIDGATKRRFWLDNDANQIRYYTPTSPDLVRIDDLVELTELRTDEDQDGVYETLWSVGDYRLTPLNAPADDRPYELIEVPSRGNHWFCPEEPGSVQVKGRFGWSTVPTGIVAATTIVATRLLRRVREAPFGIVSVGLDGAPIRISSKDPDVWLLIEDYIRGGRRFV